MNGRSASACVSVKRGTQRGDADVVAAAGEGDGERVERPFDEDRDGAGGQRRCSLGEAVQLVALGEQVGLGGVQVLGNGLAGSSSSCAGLRRPIQPWISAPSRMAKTSRSRKRSMTRPVEA